MNLICTASTLSSPCSHLVVPTQLLYTIVIDWYVFSPLDSLYALAAEILKCYKPVYWTQHSGRWYQLVYISHSPSAFHTCKTVACVPKKRPPGGFVTRQICSCTVQTVASEKISQTQAAQRNKAAKQPNGSCLSHHFQHFPLCEPPRSHNSWYQTE